MNFKLYSRLSGRDLKLMRYDHNPKHRSKSTTEFSNCVNWNGQMAKVLSSIWFKCCGVVWNKTFKKHPNNRHQPKQLGHTTPLHHIKWKILSLFTHPYVVVWFSFFCTTRYFEKCLSAFSFSSQWSMVIINILRNIHNTTNIVVWSISLSD